MLFNSYIFILFFLPICISGYFILNHFKYKKAAQIFLLGMSLWFYGYFNISYIFLIICSVVINYFFYRFFNFAKDGRGRKCFFYVALFVNIGLLFYFKYYNFFLENINFVFKQNFVLKSILLPLGISFFTFQQISFIADAYKGEIPNYHFVEYASFVTYFPQLIAGPIVTHDELIPQFLDDTKKRFCCDNFAKGIYVFSLGLGKKVLLADTFGNAANWGFDNIASLNSTNAILTMLSYTVQIYFDFSGYCDMAVGIGKMMNIDLPLNFNSPYKALTITEFWKRWHITLTRFFTKYVYIPLGGNRVGGKTYINIMIVFLLSGIWHGASWNFILWGICHGAFEIITRKFKSQFKYMHPALSWMFTFLFLNVTWVIFRANTIRDAFKLFNCIISFDFGGISPDITSCFNLPEFILLGKTMVPILTYYPQFFLMAFFIMAIVILLYSRNAYEKMERFVPGIFNIVTTAILLVWCIFSFSGVSTFLYFNF